MRATIYDLESFPNVFTCTACSFSTSSDLTVWEISPRRNDILSLLEWLMFLARENVPMIGYNNVGYDYHLIHALINQQALNASDLYRITSDIIGGEGRAPIWQNERNVPQIDLYKIHHFDNKAKRQSLKGLEFNMRSESIQDLPFEPGIELTPEQTDQLISYNAHDVRETQRFARITLPNIDLRRDMLDSGMLQGDVFNFNDTKLGKELLIQRLGDDACYERSRSGRYPRQTIRSHIPLRNVIFPYIKFHHPEFVRVHQWLLEQTLGPVEIDGIERASTKGVLTGLKATINGFDFNFGTGGIHGSLERVVRHSTDTHVIIDADVASLYPSIAIVNQLSPEHLGSQFVKEYADLKTERFKYPKKTAPNEALKLALNGTYGDSNNPYSPFYDPLFTVRITLNGQLMLCMLSEWLLMGIPELEMLAINTDGLTVVIPRGKRPLYDSICKQWEQFTCLELEFVDYKSMWLRDVNNYVALDTKGKVKQKGAYWHPNITGTIDEYNDSISNAGPSAWHKDLSAPIIQYAAVQQMVHGVPIETTIYGWTNPFDFCFRAKVSGKDKLFLNDAPQQRVTRFYVARQGGSMVKVSPPVQGKQIGAFKKANGVSEYEYNSHDPFVWNEAIHTKNRSTYQERRTSIINGYQVAECNHISRFDFLNLNYEYYIGEAKKLLIEG